MGNSNYHKCLAYQRDWQSLSNKKNKVKYAKYMLERYFNPENWNCVRFSNKVYFKQSSQH